MSIQKTYKLCIDTSKTQNETLPLIPSIVNVGGGRGIPIETIDIYIKYFNVETNNKMEIEKDQMKMIENIILNGKNKNDKQYNNFKLLPPNEGIDKNKLSMFRSSIRSYGWLHQNMKEIGTQNHFNCWIILKNGSHGNTGRYNIRNNVMTNLTDNTKDLLPNMDHPYWDYLMKREYILQNTGGGGKINIGVLNMESKNILEYQNKYTEQINKCITTRLLSGNKTLDDYFKNIFDIY